VYDTWPEYFLRKVTELLQKDLECDKSTLDKSIEIFLKDFPDFSSFDLQAKKEKEKEQEEKLKEKEKNERELFELLNEENEDSIETVAKKTKDTKLH